MLIPDNTTICVGASGMGAIAVYPTFEEGNDPRVVVVATVRDRQPIVLELDPVDALRLGRVLVAAGELLTRPQDRIAMEG